MSSRSTLRIILTAMFAALICVATMFIRIPTPGTGGYAKVFERLKAAKEQEAKPE